MIRRGRASCAVMMNTPECRGDTRARCYACGGPACLGCSRRRAWYKWARVRVCFDCLEDDRRHRLCCQTSRRTR